VRGVAPDGISIAEALLEALTHRALASHWCFPDGLPKSSVGMLKALLRVARELDPSDPFCLKHPFTPDEMLSGGRFTSASAYVRAARNALKDRNRVCSLEGDLFLIAVAALHFGVRIMVLGGTTLTFPHPQLMYDFHPADDVVADRSLVLLMCPSGGGFNWLYPDGTRLKDISPDFSSEVAFITVALPSPLGDWTDDRNTDRSVVGYSEMKAAAAAAEAEAKARASKGSSDLRVAQLACKLPLQRLTVRGNTSPGLDLEEALFEALTMRALVSGWEYPSPLPHTAAELRAALIIAALWLYVGFNMVYFLAALQNVPAELLEAADIDGANAWQRFRHVVLPEILPVASFVVLLSALGSFQLFELPFILLRGAGPDNAGLTIVMYLYNTGFVTGDLGYASAIGWCRAALLMSFAVLQRWVTRRQES
jgi:ABC-type proline/glycine betaine transport system permease subunit